MSGTTSPRASLTVTSPTTIPVSAAQSSSTSLPSAAPVASASKTRRSVRIFAQLPDDESDSEEEIASGVDSVKDDDSKFTPLQLEADSCRSLPSGASSSFVIFWHIHIAELGFIFYLVPSPQGCSDSHWKLVPFPRYFGNCCESPSPCGGSTPRCRSRFESLSGMENEVQDYIQGWRHLQRQECPGGKFRFSPWST